MPDRPNVLVLMDDQHRADVLGYAGDDVVRTPNLDRLAESGVTFENAYTPSPICVPARQAMAAGRLPTDCGCPGYGFDLEAGYQTFARQLAEHGYMTACAGKLHHRAMDQMQGWRRRIGMDTYVGGEGFDVQHEDTGFDVTDEAIERYGGGGADRSTNDVQAAGAGHSTQVGRDEYTVDGAVQFVREYFTSPYADSPGTDRPLALMVSLEQPHDPYVTPEERFEYYLNRVDPFDGSKPDPLPTESLRGDKPDATARERRRATAAYYGMIEAVDEGFGRVLDALENAGQDLDEWVIVFCSDHGDLTGEHGRWGKWNFYEGSVGAPLVVRYPERFDPGTVEANVSLIDLYPTLCELADVPVPDQVEGESLVAHLDGRDGSGERAPDSERTVVSEHRTGSAEDLMLKRGDLKYCYFVPEGEEVLFDLAADPEETENVVEDSAYADAVADFRERRDAFDWAAS